MKKNLTVLFTILTLVFGFSLLLKPNSALADSNHCDRGEDESADRVGDDDGGDSGCDDACTQDDVTTPNIDEADVLGSGDCDGACGAGDEQCSADCDPLGQCIFGEETILTSTDARTVLSRIINIILTLLGTVAVVIILFGGFKWMTSGGDESNIESAKKMMLAGVVGLAIVLTSYAIATFVINNLESATIE